MKNKTTVLVIGNGFDIAHKLKTKYTDFLKFCSIAASLKNSYDNNIPLLILDSVVEIKNENIWIKYFKKILDKNLQKGDNWIDFEEEISSIIEMLDKSSQNLSKKFSDLSEEMEENTDDNEKCNIFANCLVPDLKQSTMRKLRERLVQDLDKLAEVLGYYLASEWVDNEKAPAKLSVIESINPDIVVSFNYTHTFTRIYLSDTESSDTECFHIHGECGRKQEPNNMVLGIDDYWTDEKQDTHTNYAVFKKYVQRMQRRTYLDLISAYKTIDEQLPRRPSDSQNSYLHQQNETELYFYGHSLAVTDKDIIKELLDKNFGKTIVYFLNKPDEGQYMANMVFILGKKEFEKRMMENRLEFRQIPKENTDK